jgi:diguanylate cyclase (GGDEF)-like protein
MALQKFVVEAKKEAFAILDSTKDKEYRYISPLITKRPCLACHASQGYREGEIRGAISLKIPLKDLSRQRSLMAWAFGGIAAGLVGLHFFIVTFLVLRPSLRLLELQERLYDRAITDELTNLKNRRYLMERLQEELIRSKRKNAPLSLLLLDIDHFKRINDTLGHEAGDGALKHTARILGMSTRPYDTVGRFGGEEFLIIFPQTNAREALEIFERIRSSLEVSPFEREVESVRLTLSGGVSELRPQDVSVDELLARADRALYRAKESGRNRVCLAEA